MKSRSARSVVAAAFRLFSGNFRRLFRASWLAALIYAIINSLLGTAFISELYGLVLPLIVVGGLAELMFYSVGIDMLSVHASTRAMPLTSKKLPMKTFWRTLKATLCVCAIDLPLLVAWGLFYHYKLSYAIIEPNSHLTTWVVFCVATIVVTLLQLPLLYAIMRYLMRGELKFWQSLLGGYKAGISHIGHIFVVVLINAIILVVAHYVITQPAVILGMANAQSQIGAAMGDPSGMPSYMPLLCMVTFLLAGFIQAYIRMTIVFSLYYMYGAIETAESEKRQFKETTQE